MRNKTFDSFMRIAFKNGMDKADELNMKDKKRTLGPCISSLKELRKNTWDKERIDNMIYWLECYIND